MTVKRIVTTVATGSVAEVSRFYADLFDLTVAMDQGWIATLATGTQAPVQISIASQGGSGAPVPDMTIEVDNIDALYAKVQALGHVLPYPLTEEPWSVRRFFLRDPAGKLINVMSHIDKARAHSTVQPDTNSGFSHN
jgi:predicted enzyme related to lactoylglutathione lyase